MHASDHGFSSHLKGSYCDFEFGLGLSCSYYYDVGFGGGGVFLPFPIFNLAAAEFCGIQPESLQDFHFFSKESDNIDSCRNLRGETVPDLWGGECLGGGCGGEQHVREGEGEEGWGGGG